MGLRYFFKIDECLHGETTQTIKHGPQRVQIIYKQLTPYIVSYRQRLTMTFHFVPIDHMLQRTDFILTWNNFLNVYD